MLNRLITHKRSTNGPSKGAIATDLSVLFRFDPPPKNESLREQFPLVQCICTCIQKQIDLQSHIIEQSMAKSDSKTPVIVASLVFVSVAVAAVVFVKTGGLESNGTF